MTYLGTMMQAQARTGASLSQNKEIGLLNNALQAFWDSFPWEETLGEGYTFQLTNERETYGPPYVQIPTDFKTPWEAQLTIVDSNGNSIERPIEVLSRKPKRPPYGIPEWMAYDKGENGFRFDKIFKSTSTSAMYLVEYTYKRNTPVLTRTTMEDDFFAERLEQPFVNFLVTFLLPAPRPMEAEQTRQMILSQAAMADHLLDAPDFLEPAILWNNPTWT